MGLPRDGAVRGIRANGCAALVLRRPLVTAPLTPAVIAELRRLLEVAVVYRAEGCVSIYIEQKREP